MNITAENFYWMLLLAFYCGIAFAVGVAWLVRRFR